MTIWTESLGAPRQRIDDAGASQSAPQSAEPEALATEGECGTALGEPSGPLWVTIKVEEAVAALIMTLLALITLANVVTRYLVNVSLAFTEEYSIVLLLILIFVGVSSAVARNTHLKVTFFLDLMTPRVRRRFEIAGDLAMLACLGLFAFYSGRSAISSWQLGETSPGLGHPQWVYLMWPPILSVVAMARVVGCLIRAFRGAPAE